MKEIDIRTRKIGKNHPCFIIAEAGVNHNGDIETAKKLIDIAVDCKVDAVKFQTWITEEIILENTDKATYQKEQTGDEENQFEMLKKLELKHEDFIVLKEYCDEKGILFMSTPDDPKSAKFLSNLVPIFKIGSAEYNNLSYFDYISTFKKPTIISTGMCSIDDVKRIKEVLDNGNLSEVIFLHCTTDYPTALDNVNLNAMHTLEKEIGTLVGYSDHTEGILVPVIAVLEGACVLEKHYTYDRNANGPDHQASLSPEELKEMVEKIRMVEAMSDSEKNEYKKTISEYETIMGSFEKKPSDRELEIKKVITKYVTARVDISKGTKITFDMLGLKRASGGDFHAENIYDVVGKVAKREILPKNTISREDLE